MDVRKRKYEARLKEYLRAGVVARHTFEETGISVPRGGPLSPLLSNIMLNKLDQNWKTEGIGLSYTQTMWSSSARVSV